MYRVFIIQTNGKVEVSEQKKAPELEQLKKAVGGWIETVPYFTTFEGMRRGIAYCNEEGRINGLTHNAVASTAWRNSCPKGDPSRMRLHGDVIFYAKIPSGEIAKP